MTVRVGKDQVRNKRVLPSPLSAGGNPRRLNGFYARGVKMLPNVSGPHLKVSNEGH